MMEGISGIQNRIEEIQNRLHTLGIPPRIDTPTALQNANNNNEKTFASILALQRNNANSAGGAGLTSNTTSGAAVPSSYTPVNASSISTMGSPGCAVPSSTVVPSAPPLPGSANTVAPIYPDTSQVNAAKSGWQNIYMPIINKYASQYGLDPALIEAVIEVESDGNPHCKSNAGAMGLMQLMPENVTEAGIHDPFDPEENIAAGTKQLSDFLKTYNGNLDLALASYNAGPGNVRKYGGIPPFRETQNYIKKIHALIDKG